MPNQFARTQLVLGPDAMDALARARVAVFGIGGVGGNCAEALARSGIGALDLIDDDVVCPSNINRQVIATLSVVGRSKVDVMAERIADINPQCRVTTHRCFYLPATADLFDFSQYDYIIDAVDTVTAKLQLIERAQESGTPIISSMGAANKLDPTAFEVADIYDTSICPLAKIIRKECRKRGIRSLKVVYSTEPARQLFANDLAGSEEPKAESPDRKMAETAGVESVMAAGEGEEANGGAVQAPLRAATSEKAHVKRSGTPGSVAFVPPVVGLIMAGEVVRDIAGNQRLGN